MKNISTTFKRANVIESTHRAKLFILDLNGRVLLNSGDEDDFIYPRSSIKIFQAIPFIESQNKYNIKLNPKIIALACSSHRGENFHIKELEKWVKKIGIKKKKLQCGIHNPLDLKASEKLFRSNGISDELHNNCAGKHLAMISSCILNNYSVNNYLSFDHPHQIKIRNVFEKFTNKKIKNKYFGIDGCSAPQYAFRIKDLGKMLMNLYKSYHGDYHYSNEVKCLVNSIISNPKYIGGSDSLDSRIMSISKKKIFCKGGAEGVLLFVDLRKGIVGVIKIVDGNERAIPSLVYNLFKKFSIMNTKQLNELKNIYNFEILNHAKLKIGSIETKI